MSANNIGPFGGLSTAEGLPQGCDLGIDRRFWASTDGREVGSHESGAIEGIGGKLTLFEFRFIV